MPISSLLNPAGRPDSTSRRPSPSFSPPVFSSPPPTFSPAPSSAPSSPLGRVQHSRYRHPTHFVAEFARTRPKGAINFPPFQHGLDLPTRRGIEDFGVVPFGEIDEHCRHIPYASGKKDFHEKTGRDGFSVFHYFFRLPGEAIEYQIMWDYNVGLVRMTPFFKCCKYSKTTPAKMLNLNPGLRDITHSITGGSIMAQGYWMPYSCARAVCATFCYSIAAALVPIFGPDFPAACVPPNLSEYGHMVIDPAIVAAAIRDAERMRLHNHEILRREIRPASASASSTSSTSVSAAVATSSRRHRRSNPALLASPIEPERLPSLSRLLPPLPSLPLPTPRTPVPYGMPMSTSLPTLPTLRALWKQTQIPYLSSPGASDTGSDVGSAVRRHPPPHHTLPPLFQPLQLPHDFESNRHTVDNKLCGCLAPSACYPSPPLPSLLSPDTHTASSPATPVHASHTDCSNHASPAIDMDAAELLVGFHDQKQKESESSRHPLTLARILCDEHELRPRKKLRRFA